MIPPNSALLQPELLFEVFRVVENTHSPNPSFMYALLAIAEACGLNERVYFFGPLSDVGELPEDDPWVSLLHSSIFTGLVSTGLLVELTRDEIETGLATAADGYDFVDFIADYAWLPGGFIGTEQNAEEELLSAWVDILRHAPGALGCETLVEDDPHFPIVAVAAMPLLEQRFSVQDILRIEGLNRYARGFHDLSRRLGMNLCSSLLGLPHQIQEIRTTNDYVRSRVRLNGHNNPTIQPEAASNVFACPQDFGRLAVPSLKISGGCEHLLTANLLIAELMAFRSDCHQFRACFTRLLGNSVASYSELSDHLSTMKTELSKVLHVKGREVCSRIIYRLLNVGNSSTNNIGMPASDTLDVTQRILGFHDSVDLGNAFCRTHLTNGTNPSAEKLWHVASEFTTLIGKSLLPETI